MQTYFINKKICFGPKQQFSLSGHYSALVMLSVCLIEPKAGNQLAALLLFNTATMVY